MRGRPEVSEYTPNIEGYIGLVPEDDIVKALDEQLGEFGRRFRGANPDHRYAPGKWTVREMVGHLGDAERILGYRLLCIARGERASLPPFEEDDYVREANFSGASYEELLSQLENSRRANVSLLRTIPEEAWMRRGLANEREITVRAQAYAICGHARHHLRTLADRYGL